MNEPGNIHAVGLGLNCLAGLGLVLGIYLIGRAFVKGDNRYDARMGVLVLVGSAMIEVCAIGLI